MKRTKYWALRILAQPKIYREINNVNYSSITTHRWRRLVVKSKASVEFNTQFDRSSNPSVEKMTCIN